MIHRTIYDKVIKGLSRQAAVALIGPRQVGKTTLALEIAQERNALYLDLEDASDRNKLIEPKFFLSTVADQLVILDEIHRTPDLFQALRGIIDEGRQKGQRTGRFLLLGSASLDLLKQSGESLAGRIAYVDMGPLTLLEVNKKELNTLWVRGGFPDSFLAINDETSLAIRKDFIRTYLERDVPMLGPRIPAETLGRLWTMLAHCQSTPLNASRLGESLAISFQTVSRYIDLLVDLLLVRRLPPYIKNVGKRLVKSPKVYIRDSGLLHALLNIESFHDLLGHPVVGASWEGFVIETVLAASPERTHASYYRTAAGAEIDLFLEMPDGQSWALEIKRGLSPKLTQGFYNAIEDLRPDRTFVIYAGEDRYPVSKDVEAMSLAEFLTELETAS